jgi:uncharacterized protein (UPF0218 family)
MAKLKLYTGAPVVSKHPENAGIRSFVTAFKKKQARRMIAANFGLPTDGVTVRRWKPGKVAETIITALKRFSQTEHIEHTH